MNQKEDLKVNEAMGGGEDHDGDSRDVKRRRTA